MHQLQVSWRHRVSISPCLPILVQVSWRRCFVDALRPQHLPQGWSVEHAAYSRAWEGVHERLVSDGEFGRARVREVMAEHTAHGAATIGLL